MRLVRGQASAQFGTRASVALRRSAAIVQPHSANGRTRREPRLLLFDGGALQGTASTWVWQNAQWTRAATTGPSLRNGHAIAYDLTRGKVVLFGGFRSGQDFSDAWEWDGTRWTQITPR